MHASSLTTYVNNASVKLPYCKWMPVITFNFHLTNLMHSEDLLSCFLPFLSPPF